MFAPAQVVVTPVAANLTSRRWLGGRMDPYCVVTYNGNMQSTPTAFRGGNSPRWSTPLVFAPGPDTILHVQVRDAHHSRHGKLVGEARVPLQGAAATDGRLSSYPLTRDGRTRGSITLQITAPMNYGYNPGYAPYTPYTPGYAPYTAGAYPPQYSVVAPVAPVSPVYTPRVSVSRYYQTAPSTVTYTSALPAAPLTGLQQSYFAAPGLIAPAVSQVYSYRSRPSFC